MSEVEVGTKRGSDFDEYGEISYKKSRNDKEKMRFLMVGRHCGAIIGKGGENIKRLRSEYGVHMNLPDTRSNERILTLQGDKDGCLAVLKDIISSCKEAPYSVDVKRKCTYEVNFLAQSDQVGAVIGKGGQKIKDIREESRGKVRVYQDCLPNSNERVVAIGGDDETCLLAAFEIVLGVLRDHPKKNQTIYYDPRNRNNDMPQHQQQQQHSNNQLPPGGPHNNQLGALGAGLGALGGLGGLGGLASAATLLGQLGVGSQAGGLLGAGGVNSLLGNNMNPRDGMMGSDNRNPQGGGYGDHPGGFGMHRNAGARPGERNPAGPMLWSDDRLGDLRGNEVGYNNKMAGNYGQYNGNNQNADNERGDFTQMQTVAKVTVSNDMCGAIIGKSGQRVKEIRQATGVKVDFSETERGSKEDRVITITGTQQQTIAAQQMMAQCVRNRNM